ncbi:MAG: Gfo/Idh/MocA family oxidoreductase [Bryobacterales bacterium]|nr:Gfo/Idh/MocA family oxidoreductase [Bryobacterales bacterium]
MTSRRTFTKAAALTALSYQRIPGANDRVRLGFIGVGNRGTSLVRATKEYADQQIAAVCDIRRDFMENAAQIAGTSPELFNDYRDVIAKPDIDAVVIASPDHWHALMLIDACNAGKDVYIEKPLSLTIYEGRRMVETAMRTKRVVQVGIQRRSAQYCREAAEFVRSGEIGHVTVVRATRIANEYPHGIGSTPDADPPPGIDWDLYLGPAPAAPYNENRFSYKFRWFHDYSGGQITDNGVHYLDLIQWGLGQDAPLSVTAIGGKYAIQDNRQTVDTMEALWLFPGATLLTFSDFSCNAAPVTATKPFLAEWRGTKGTVYVYGDGWEAIPERQASMPAPGGIPLPGHRERRQEFRDSYEPAMEARQAEGRADTRFHIRNFLDCIKSRETPNCDIETAHRSTTTANLANIALKTRQHLNWDRMNERFTNSDDANRYLHYEYRAPWKLG